MRLALRSAAAHGYYVFDELMTEEAGMIDFLAVGPVGALVVVVRDEPGTVTADVDSTLYLNGRPFPETRTAGRRLGRGRVRQAEAAGSLRLPRHLLYAGRTLIPRAKTRTSSEGVCPTWDLPLAFEEAEREHTPTEVAELADLIREVYGRPPFVVPEEGEI